MGKRFPASIFQTEFALWNGTRWRANFVRGKTACPKGWCGWHEPHGLTDLADRIKRFVQLWNDQTVDHPGWRQTCDSDYHVLEGWIFEPV